MEINKDFIPYEQALALKELGFDEPCIKYYWTDGMFVKGYEDPFNYNKRDNVISSPLYQQAFRWFREKYNLNQFLHPNSKFYFYTLFSKNDCPTLISDDYSTYEEAELECLKTLIEIIKNK